MCGKINQSGLAVVCVGLTFSQGVMKSSAVLVTAAEISMLLFKIIGLHGYAGGRIVVLDKLMHFEAVLGD